MVIVSSGVASANNTIKVATDRYVVLDDPIASGGSVQAGWSLPDAGEWGSSNNRWTGKQTTIGAIALYLDSNGYAQSGKSINFTIYYPDGSSSGSEIVVTDSDGVAKFYKDLDDERYYGQWQVGVESDGVSSNTTFIYNWWGCGWSSNNCNNKHSGEDPGDRGTTTANSPYTISWEEITTKEPEHNSGMSGSGWSDDFCTVCHQSYDGNPTTSNVEGSTTKDFFPDDTHSIIRCDNSSCHNPDGGTGWSDHNGGTMTIGSCDDCHSRTDITMKSTLTGAVSDYSNSSGEQYHSSNSNVPCVICHGPMHNITKPDPTVGGLDADTEDSHCTTCHTGLSKHNDVVGCVQCHSEDIHVIKYRQPDESFSTVNSTAVDCTDCHQGSGLSNFSSAPTVPTISHSQNTQNGSLWSEGRTGNFWTSASEVTKCEYCHSDSKHMASALGKPAQFNGSGDIVGGDLTGAWCGLCHYQLNPKYSMMITTMGSGLVPPEITGNATYGSYTGDTASDGDTGYFNHSAISDYSDNSCSACHDAGSDVVGISDFMHNVSHGRGGPNCISCHDTGKYASKVDVSSINTSNSIHSGLNSGAADTTGNADNKICWGCHATDGTQPGDDHPSKYKTPYTCYECHDGTPPSQASSAFTVSNHFKSGTNMTSVSGAANNSASCLECHNKAEMKGSYTEPDSEYNNQSLVSHYGIKRTTGDLSNYNTSTYCVYCHNATNEFDAFVTGINASITNHSNSVFSPSCANTTCHNSGRIHDSSLKIPTVTPTLCKSCHTTKVEHNSSVACADCHLSADTQIHAVRFLQPDESFGTSATAVGCADCHQGGGLANFSGATEVGMVRHSQNTLNGSLWDRGSAFWTNISETTKCEFCHGDSKHDASGLGYINDTKGSNTVNGDLTGTWCAGCHYQGDTNYDTMVATLSIVPPEITGNATYGNYTTADDGTTNYFNHSAISGFTDADCATCHDKNESTTITPLMHNVSSNNGGTDCVICHDIGGPVKNINISVIVNGSHSGMNSAADLTGVTDGVQLCWLCHGDGSRPQEHPSNYNTPHYCDDCHSPANVSSPLVVNESVPTIYRHAAGADGRNQINKSQLVCEDCHVNMLTFSNPDESTLAQVAHYTNNSTSSGWLTCNDGCHKDVVLGAAYAGAEQTTMGGVGNVTCMYCHNLETVANGFSTPPLGEGRNAIDGSVSIHNRSIVLVSTGRCDDVGVCHGVPNDPRL